MADTVIEDVKNRVDILEVIGRYVKLEKAGASYRALCPFHMEKSPSFFVSPSRQMWRCFGGCGEGGDVFKFIMKIEGVEFGDALRQVAAIAGVTLPERDGAFAKTQTERKRLQELVETATQFFEHQLFFSKPGNLAKAYLEKRGVQEETMRLWRLGYAPASLHALTEYLTPKGYRQEEIGRAGLSLRTEKGVLDRFRSRIMFPICNIQSQVAGFGGRIFGQEGKELAKYLNTTNTLLYDKSRILYGLDKAKTEIRRRDACIVVEGYMDAILGSQTGAPNIVATSGTALTIPQLQMLKRYTQNLHTAFDMDPAGDHATRRGIDLAIAEGFAVRVIVMPQGKDPADVASEDPALWLSLLEKTQTIQEFYFSSALVSGDRKTAEGKRKIAEILVPSLAKIPNRIEQDHWAKLLAKELDVSEDSIRSEIARNRVLQEQEARPPQYRKEAQEVGETPVPRRRMLETRLLMLLLRMPGDIGSVTEEALAACSLETQKILEAFQKNGVVEGTSGLSEASQELLQQLGMEIELEELDEDTAAKELAWCIEEISRMQLRARLETLTKEIRKAESEMRAEDVQELVREAHRISSRVKR